MNRLRNRLEQLARLYGVETSYHDALGNFVQPPSEAILSVLRILGASVEKLSDVAEAIESRNRELAQQWTQPVAVLEEGSRPTVAVRFPAAADSQLFRLHLREENGSQHSKEFRPGDLACQETDQTDGTQYHIRLVQLDRILPMGYHQLRLEGSCPDLQVSLICAPQRAYQPPFSQPCWGAFLPTYALRSRHGWGSGDFFLLRELLEWVHSQGGNFVATLPLFAAFLDEPFDPSPYAPVSRLFWNEFFVDPRRAPEWQNSRAARRKFESSTFQALLQEQRLQPRVDYRGEMALKRSVLEPLSQQFFSAGGHTSAGFQDFLRDCPHAQYYAAFRAVTETRREVWHMWPARMRQGTLSEADFDPHRRDYHLYVQYLANQQFREVEELSQDKDLGIYLDLPLGVHPDGYDVWANQSLFVNLVSGGAPPDEFFTAGQDWGFPPIHPEASRRAGHLVFRETLNHLCRHSNCLRIDHVMSLCRLFWVPRGRPAQEGVYVHYPATELFSIVVIESCRNQCVVVGEDLGTVPDQVRERMQQHGFHRMFVGPFEISLEQTPPLKEPSELMVASINTHDMATFSAFWSGLDVENRHLMGLLDEEAVAREKEYRLRLQETFLHTFGVKRDPNDLKLQLEVVRRWLAHLAASQARYLIVNLEDLWLETASQNVPGTGLEGPNWQHKARLWLDQIRNSADVADILKEVSRVRQSVELG